MSEEYEYDAPNYNASGALEGWQECTWDEKLLCKHLYHDGVIQEAINYQVIVGQESPVKGVYQNGRPHTGYFVHADNEMELYLTDFYEEGNLVAQYSRPVMYMDEEGMVHSAEDEYEFDYDGKGTRLTRKTIFNNGTIFDGLNYKFYKLAGSVFILATEIYKESKRVYVDILVGAVHYAEFFRIKFLPEGFEIVSGPRMEGEAATLTVLGNKHKGEITLTAESESSFEYSIHPVTDDFPSDYRTVNYYKSEEDFYYQCNKDIVYGESLYGSGNTIVAAVFVHMLEKFTFISAVEENDYSTLLEQGRKREFFCKLFLSEDNIPVHGTQLKKESGRTYGFIKYKKGNVVESRSGLSSEELEELAMFNEKDFMFEE